MSEVTVNVGAAEAYMTLSVALSQLPAIAASDQAADTVILRLVDAFAVHPPVTLSLPPSVKRLIIKGRGEQRGDAQAAPPAGVMHTTVAIATGFIPVQLSAGADVEYCDIRFTVQGLQTNFGFLVDAAGSTLRFTNCVASASGAGAAPLVFAGLRGFGTRLIGKGLRVGDGYTHGVRAEATPQSLLEPPTVLLEDCGFRGLVTGVEFLNISHARIARCFFAECQTGLNVSHRPGAPQGGTIEVTDNRFSDCRRGAVVTDSTRTGAPLGPPWPQHRSFEPDGLVFDAPRTGRRTLRFLRNEFRAPDVSAYPAIPAGETDAWGVLPGETVGLLAEFDPNPAGPTSQWPPQLLLQANVFHLLDHGVMLAVGSDGQAVIDRCTFVANSVRSVFVSFVSGSSTRDLGLTITRSLFQARDGRPWLGLPEQTPVPVSTPDRYRSGAVELWESSATVFLRGRIWVGANLLADYGTEHPRIHALVGSFGSVSAVETGAWEGAQTSGPAGVTTWTNPTWSEPTQALVLRLPRIRNVQGNTLTSVEFDYHAVLGTPAAPQSTGGLDTAWLAMRSVELSDPVRDYHGEVNDFHPLSPGLIGAARERRSWQAWPLYGWAPNQDHVVRTIDAGQVGVPYFLNKIPASGNALTFAELELAFTGESPGAVTNLIDGAQVNDGGVVVRVSFPAHSNCDYHQGTCSLHGTLISLEIGGVSVEVPTWDEDTQSTDWAGEWDERFVEYWLELAEAYVEALTAADHNNRIVAWVMGDENSPTPSVLEVMARFRDMVERVDPLKRPVLAGLQSDSVPHWGGVPTAVGGVPLHWDDSLPLDHRSWNPPPWSSQRGATLFLDREPRQFRGSRLKPPGFFEARQCLVGSLGAAEAEDPEDPSSLCRFDFGVVMAAPLDEFGRPRFTTHHVQSSWHFNRTVGGLAALDLLHSQNRSYAHHHGLVLRDTLEIGRLIADRSLTVTRQDGHTFFNAPVLFSSDAQPGAPATLGPYRHDFWAGVHHAGGVYTYNLKRYAAPGDEPDDSPGNLFSRAFDEGMELIKGTNQHGEGLRQALANGQRWQSMRVGDPGPPWLTGWARSLEESENIDFGEGAGRTFGGAEFPGEVGYYDLCVTALRLGATTWLIVTKSTDDARSLEFDYQGAVMLLGDSSASLGPSGSDHWLLSFGIEIDAAVVKLS